jgi:UDP-N-acetylmuramate dehydrogenase
VFLSDHTTLRLGGPAGQFVSARTADEAISALRREKDQLLVLGGGSNLVVGDAGFAGTVVKIATVGIEVSRGERTLLTVQAGHDWDEVVEFATGNGLGGVECLSGIPGSAGATVVQNVGAYGVEIAQLLDSVTLYDRKLDEVRTWLPQDLGLTYRTSMLKGHSRYVVLAVSYAVTADGLSAPIRYPELAAALGVNPGDRVLVEAARAAVLALRKGKGMVLDPSDRDTWSAGSFFTNPIIASEKIDTVLSQIRARIGADDVRIPQYPAVAVGGHKLSAAWLIEKAGFAKGYLSGNGRIGLSTKHTLAVTNRGSATTDELIAFAKHIATGVNDAFGVALVPEPVFIGCTW